MTNREKYFLKRDEYDLMMTILKNIRKHKRIKRNYWLREIYRSKPIESFVSPTDFVCPIDIVSGHLPEKCEVKNLEEALYFDAGTWENDVLDCEKCIQKWINEESEV